MSRHDFESYWLTNRCHADETAVRRRWWSEQANHPRPDPARGLTCKPPRSKPTITPAVASGALVDTDEHGVHACREYACGENGDGCCKAHVATMKGLLGRCCAPGFARTGASRKANCRFGSAPSRPRATRQRGKTLLGALVAGRSRDGPTTRIVANWPLQARAASATSRASCPAGSIKASTRPPSITCSCNTRSTSAVLPSRYQTPSG